MAETNWSETDCLRRLNVARLDPDTQSANVGAPVGSTPPGMPSPVPHIEPAPALAVHPLVQQAAQEWARDMVTVGYPFVGTNPITKADWVLSLQRLGYPVNGGDMCVSDEEDTDGAQLIRNWWYEPPHRDLISGANNAYYACGLGMQPMANGKMRSCIFMVPIIPPTALYVVGLQPMPWLPMWAVGLADTTYNVHTSFSGGYYNFWLPKQGPYLMTQNWQVERFDLSRSINFDGWTGIKNPNVQIVADIDYVTWCYGMILERAADPAPRNDYCVWMSQGMTRPQVKVEMAISDEYVGKHAADYVGGLFKTFLHRDPSQEDRNWYAGKDNKFIAEQVVNSAEAQQGY